MVSVSSTQNRGWAIGAAGRGAAVQLAFKRLTGGVRWPPPHIAPCGLGLGDGRVLGEASMPIPVGATVMIDRFDRTAGNGRICRRYLMTRPTATKNIDRGSPTQEAPFCGS